MDKLNNLLAQVAVLGNAQRQYQLQCAELGSNVVERWWGRDALSAHASTEVDVLSTDQYIDLDALLAKQAALLIRNADGAVIGAVGVTGDTSDNDECCALAGIAAAGLSA